MSEGQNKSGASELEKSFVRQAYGILGTIILAALAIPTALLLRDKATNNPPPASEVQPKRDATETEKKFLNNMAGMVVSQSDELVRLQGMINNGRLDPHSNRIAAAQNLFNFAMNQMVPRLKLLGELPNGGLSYSHDQRAFNSDFLNEITSDMRNAVPQNGAGVVAIGVGDNQVKVNYNLISQLVRGLNAISESKSQPGLNQPRQDFLQKEFESLSFSLEQQKIFLEQHGYSVTLKEDAAQGWIFSFKPKDSPGTPVEIKESQVGLPALEHRR